MKHLLMTSLALALAGSASVDPGSALAEINRLTQAHTGQALAAEPMTPKAFAERLREPLSADAAVRLALQNGRALQARLARLNVTAAEVAEASRLPNPGFRFSRLTRGSEVELARAREQGFDDHGLPGPRQAPARRPQAR